MSDKENSGVVFSNSYKKADNHPDWKGTGNFNGLHFDIAFWEKRDKNGNVFFSAKFSEPYVKQDTLQVTQQPAKQVENLAGPDDDGLPF